MTHNSNPSKQVPVDIAQLLIDTKLKFGAKIRKDTDMILIEIPDEHIMYYFTKSNHAIHPSVVIRSVITKDKTIQIVTKGYTAGNQQLFEKWLKQFIGQDQQIKSNLNQSITSIPH